MLSTAHLALCVRASSSAGCMHTHVHAHRNDRLLPLTGCVLIVQGLRGADERRDRQELQCGRAVQEGDGHRGGC
eukprot:5837743-Pleurochrysis_carterae.AAC.2